MGNATGEVREPPPIMRPAFDRRIKLEFHGARITSDGGLLAYSDLDDALGLTEIALTTLREKLVKIGARIVRHGRCVVLQLAEIAVPRALFAGHPVPDR